MSQAMILFTTHLTKLLALVVLVALLANCGSAPTKPNDATVQAGIELLTPAQRAQYQKALKAMTEQDYAKAADLLEALAPLQPKVDELPINLALALYHQGDLEGAVGTLTQLNNPHRPEAWNIKGLVAQKSGQFQQAKVHFESALSVNSQYSNALYNLALLYDVYLQDVPNAVAYYSQYVAINPDDEQTKDWLSQLQSAME